MKNHSIVFLIAALITGMVGFSGIGFEGIEIIRVFCVLFVGRFIISLTAATLFPNEKLRYLPVRNDKRRRF